MSKNDDILEQARKRFAAAETADKNEREEADTDNRFAINYEGCQWPNTIRQTRESSKPPRPCLSLNKMSEKIGIVQGEFEQMRPSIKVSGVDSVSDPKIAEIYGGIYKHIEYSSDAASARNGSHNSTLHCGRGAWRVDIEDDTDDPWVRNIVINPIPNSLSVYWDPDCKKADKSDADYMFVVDELSDDEFKAKYPGVSLDGWDKGDKKWQGWRGEKTVRVAEYWWKEKTKRTYFRIERTDGVGKIRFSVAQDIWEGDKSPRQSGDKIVDRKTVDAVKVRWCKMIAKHIIDDPHDDWPIGLIPIMIETGKEVNIGGHAKTRGMIRFAREPQQMYNYWSSAVTEQIALAPKTPYMVTPKMLEGHENQWDRSNIENFLYLYYNPDNEAPGVAPHREQPPQLSTAIAHELQRMDHDIMSAMGIYQAGTGDQGPEKSGRAIRERKVQGSLGSYPYTAKFEIALKYEARVVIGLIPYVYDTERIIRIRGEDDEERTVPINYRPDAPELADFEDKDKVKTGNWINDLSIGKYDVRVSIGPSYTTQRQEAAEQLIDLISAVPDIGRAAIDIIVENLDLPGAQKLVKRLKKLIPADLREPEEGEEQPEPQIDPETQAKLMEINLKTMEQQRKNFETAVESIKTMMETDMATRAEERADIQAFMGTLMPLVQLMQQQQQGGQAPQ